MAFVRVLLLAVIMLARLLPFILIALLVIWLWRRSVRKGKDPDFDGPVVTVDYKVVDDEDSEQDGGQDASQGQS